jgi:hypothetical protein
MWKFRIDVEIPNPFGKSELIWIPNAFENSESMWNPNRCEKSELMWKNPPGKHSKSM